MELNECIKLNDTNEIKNQLLQLINEPSKLSFNNLDVFEELLKYNDNGGIKQLTVQLIAELGKDDTKRISLTDELIVEKLKSFLKYERDDNKELIIQTLRALGNLCYDNDDARKLINADGLKCLLDVLEKYSKLNNDDKDSKRIVTTGSGYLNNLLMSYDDLQKVSLNYNILQIIETILKNNLTGFNDTENCYTQLLFVLSSISEFMIDDWLPTGLICVLVEILRISLNPEISALCLELLRMQSENNDIKLYLAKEGVCELVYHLVEKYGSNVDDEESRALLKVACDLIVLILTGDESMEYLYQNGKGPVYNDMITWLNSEDLDLTTTSILAIGNFARNDSHCIQMVENGIVHTLLGILSKHISQDGNVLIQHALLSALRNLSIAAQNKSILIQEGLVEILYKMINSEHSPVVFKLLGTFRMIVDGQEETAIDLIQRKQFIERLVYWCYNSDHLGVRGEVPRLLAWLIKNCHKTRPFRALLSVNDSLKCLTEMISSMHVVMQNEALLALNLICLTSRNRNDSLNNENVTINNENVTINNENVVTINNGNDLAKMFVVSDVGKHLTFMMNKYYEKIENGTLENLLTLIEQLTDYTEIIDHLNVLKVDDALMLFKNLKTGTIYAKRIDTLIDVIRKGNK